MNTALKWTGAIVLSLLAHAGTAALFEPDEKPTDLALIAGGEAMEVTVLGNAFQETLQAGDPSEPVEPLEMQPENVEPVETTEVAPVPSPVTAETPSEVAPTEADVILPADEMPAVAAVAPEITATVAPAETIVPEEKPEQQPEPEKVEPKKSEPEPEKKIEPKTKPEKKKPVRKMAGEAGQQKDSARRGQADGIASAAASSATGKKGAKSQQSGNSISSNYKGKVQAKLNRVRKTPPRVNGETLRGSVTVRFVVSSGGGIGNLTVAKSSGSSIMDQAALDIVRRAAPFPKIPANEGIDSWPFVIPISFSR